MGGLANGALFLGVILGPGYLFVRLISRDVPLRSQSELEGLVEMLIVGVTSALVSAVLMLGVQLVQPSVDLTRLIDGGAESFLQEDALGALVTVASFLLIAYFVAFVSAVLFRTWKMKQLTRPGNRMSHGSVLYGLTMGQEGSIVSVSTDFGKIFCGEMIGFTRTSKSDRELALGGKHLYFVEPGGGGEKVFFDGTVLIRESRIEFIHLHDPPEKN